jgi:DNA-binding transcriptional regulator YiaG
MRGFHAVNGLRREKKLPNIPFLTKENKLTDPETKLTAQMTAAELRKARAELGLTGEELGRVLLVTGRAVRAWERDDKPTRIPGAVAILVRMALKNPTVRRELGISS